MNEEEAYQIDWRGFFSSIGVEWRDRGPNTSRDNVNICCPFCGQDDAGFHMPVSETIEAYHCYRSPRRHSGRSFIFLLTGFGIKRWDAIRLLNQWRSNVIQMPAQEARDAPDKAWSRFQAAATTPACLAYLERRLFDDPLQTAAQFDLRCAKEGQWAQRLLIPVQWQGELLTWIGRAMRPGLEPRYNNRPCNDDSYIYAPRPQARIQILVEGPLDALKLAAALRMTNVSGVALCSKTLNASKMLKLKLLPAQAWHLMLDNDAPLIDSFSMQKELAASLKALYKGRIRPPNSFKDAGAMPEGLVRELWGSDEVGMGWRL